MNRISLRLCNFMMSFCNSTKAHFVVNGYIYMMMVVGFAAPYTVSAKAASESTEFKNSKSARINEDINKKKDDCKNSGAICLLLKDIKDSLDNCDACDTKKIEKIVKKINKKLGDCDDVTVCSELLIIDSKIDALNLGTNCCSTVDVIDSKIDVIDSKIDALNLGTNCCSTVDVINNNVDATNSTVDVISSKIDVLNNNTNCCSVVDVINSVVDVIDSKIDALNVGTNCCSTVDVINSTVDVISNTTKATNSTVDVISSKIDVLNNNTNCCSVVDVINSVVDVIDSKIDALNVGTNCCSTVDVINSTVDVISNTTKATNSTVDVISSKIDVLNNNANCCSVVDVINSVVDVIDSKIDALNLGTNCCSTVDIINSTVDVISSKIDVIGGVDLCGPTAISATTTITNPGNYCVANSFNGSITIASSDVYLDLNERTVTNNSGNAVEVLSGLTQVTITNGFVIGSDPGIKVNNNCSAITISDVSALNSGNQGIWFDGVSASNIVRCEMLSAITGLQIDNSTQILVTDCIASSNTQAGIALYNSTDCCVTGCKAVGNGAGTSGVDTYGIVSDSGSCNIFEKCIALDTEIVGTAEACPTCFVPYMDPLVIQDCTISTVITARGIALLNSEQNSKIIDCEVGCTQSGFTFIECNRVLSPNLSQAFGIALDSLTSASFAAPALDLVASATVHGGDSATSVAWLVNNGNNYLAVGEQSATNQVQIFAFDPASTMSLVVEATLGITFSPFSVAWLVCDGSNYLAAGGGTGGLGEINISEFNPTLDSLISITTKTTGLVVAIQSVAWLITDNNNYLAVGGRQNAADAGNSLAIVEFNPTLNSLTTVTRVPAFSDGNGSTVYSVAWLVSNGHSYVAVGGQPAFENNTVKVFEFIPTTSSLNLIATSSSIIGNGEGGVFSVAWFVCDGANYLATGGIDSGSNEVVQILDFNILSTPTLAEVASLNGENGIITDSIAWFVCEGNNYLAAGSLGDPENLKIFEFDPTSTTSLSQVAQNPLSDGAFSVAWLVSEGQSYLAAGGSTVNILNFGCNEGVLPTNNIIKNNLVYNTEGVGINGDSTVNLIAGNVAYNNNQNYGDSVLTSQINSNGIGGIALDSLLNRSLPPLVSSAIDVPTIISDIESIVENISDQIGECGGNTICSELSIIDSKIDILISGDPCEPTVITATRVISSPGNYCVANSFNGSITIASSDVYLDLNERTVTNNSGNAIEVSSGLEKITIINGFVTGSSSGIQVDSDCSKITISNIVAANCGQQGILLTDVSASNIVRSKMLSAITGLKTDNSTQILVTDCIASSNTQAGIALTSCTDCCVTGCKAIGNGVGTAGIDTYGIVSDSGSCNIIEKCIVVDTEIVGTFTCPPDCFVPYMDPLVIQDCTISTTVAVARGITLLNSEQNSKIIDCEVGCTQSGVTSNSCEYERILSPNNLIQSFGIALDSLTTESSAPLTLDFLLGGAFGGNESAAWLVNNGNSYLAAGGIVSLHNLDIYLFNPSTNSLEVIVTASSMSVVKSLAWLVCGDNNYLAANDQVGLNVFQFDTTDATLNLVASFTDSNIIGNVNSIAWLIDNGNCYIGTGNQNPGSVFILEFNPALNSLITVTEIPGFITPPEDNQVFSVAWLVNNYNNYLAIGGATADLDTLKIFEFIPTTSSLNFIAGSSSIPPFGFVRSVAWLECNGKNYVASGGADFNGNEVVQILDFNITMSTLSEVASFTSYLPNAYVGSLAWLVCDSKNYLAEINVGDPAIIRILEFDSTSTTSLSQIVTFVGRQGVTTPVECAWLVSGGQPYLVAAIDNLDIFSFGCSAQGVLPTNNIIKNNLVYNTDGVGINGDSTANFIVGNVAYNNDANYGADVAAAHIFSGGIAATLPNPFLNSSFPPL